MTRKSLLSGMFLFCLLFALLTLLPFFSQPAAAQCAPPECYPTEPTYQPPPTESGNGGGSWSGYSDGRLNPDMAEYYSVWCASDYIEVWGGSPSPQLINIVPLLNVIMLSEGGSFDAGVGMTVTRSSADTITISGSSGYNAPNPGSKSFSLNECIARNGGVPEAPEPPIDHPVIPPPPEETPDPAEEAGQDVALCLVGSESLGELIWCLDFFAPDDPSLSYIYVISWAIATFCSGGLAPFALVAAVPAIRLWRRRRK